MSTGLTAKQLESEVMIPLKATEFLNLQTLLIFVEDNQGGRDVTQVNRMILLGQPIQTTNMKVKRGSGAGLINLGETYMNSALQAPSLPTLC